MPRCGFNQPIYCRSLRFHISALRDVAGNRCVLAHHGETLTLQAGGAGKDDTPRRYNATSWLFYCFRQPADARLIGKHHKHVEGSF